MSYPNRTFILQKNSKQKEKGRLHRFQARALKFCISYNKRLKSQYMWQKEKWNILGIIFAVDALNIYLSTDIWSTDKLWGHTLGSGGVPRVSKGVFSFSARFFSTVSSWWCLLTASSLASKGTNCPLMTIRNCKISLFFLQTRFCVIQQTECIYHFEKWKACGRN